MSEIADYPAEDTLQLADEMSSEIHTLFPEFQTCRYIEIFDETQPDTALGPTQCPAALITLSAMDYSVQTDNLWYDRKRTFKVYLFSIRNRPALTLPLTAAHTLARHFTENSYLQARWRTDGIAPLSIKNPLLSAAVLTLSLYER